MSQTTALPSFLSPRLWWDSTPCYSATNLGVFLLRKCQEQTGILKLLRESFCIFAFFKLPALKWFLSTQISVLLNFWVFISVCPVLASQVFKCFLVNFLNIHLAVHLLFIVYGHILKFCHVLFPSCILWMFLCLLCFSVALTGLFFNWALHPLKVHDKESKWTEENKFLSALALWVCHLRNYIWRTIDRRGKETERSWAKSCVTFCHQKNRRELNKPYQKPWIHGQSFLLGVIKAYIQTLHIWKFTLVWITFK